MRRNYANITASTLSVIFIAGLTLFLMPRGAPP
jgi:hypothetical protein